MKKISEWIRHNQGVGLSVAVIIGIGIWLYGCDSKVTSLIEPSKMVTSAELELELQGAIQALEIELDNLLKRAKLKRADLVRQDQIKQKLINFAAITVDAGTLNPAGVVGLLFSVLGVGAVIDNRLKDKVIKNRPLKPISPTE